MPVSNKWGDSAVDATRKNALPPYIDEIFDEGIELKNTTPIIWIESDQWIGEGIKFEPYFSGSGDSNKFQIFGSTTSSSPPEWTNIMTLTAQSGNLTIKGSGTFGGNVSISGATTIGGALRTGAITGTSTMNISGATTLGTTRIGAITGTSTMNISKDVTLAGEAIKLDVGSSATSVTGERDIMLHSPAGVVYMYSAATTNGNRGFYGKNSEGTGHYFVYCTQDNLVHSNSFGTSVAGTCIRDILVQDSASSSVGTRYIKMVRK